MCRPLALVKVSSREGRLKALECTFNYARHLRRHAPDASANDIVWYVCELLVVYIIAVQGSRTAQAIYDIC